MVIGGWTSRVIESFRWVIWNLFALVLKIYLLQGVSLTTCSDSKWPGILYTIYIYTRVCVSIAGYIMNSGLHTYFCFCQCCMSEETFLLDQNASKEMFGAPRVFQKGLGLYIYIYTHILYIYICPLQWAFIQSGMTPIWGVFALTRILVS